MQLNEANWCTVTLRCLSVDNSLLSIDNPNCSSTSQTSNTVIFIWFSVRKKLLQNFLRGIQGEGGRNALRKVQEQNLKYFLNWLIQQRLSDVTQMTLWNTKYYEWDSESLVNFIELVHMLNSLYVLELFVEYRTINWERNGRGCNE